jgi:hypothetical protein
MKTPNTPQGWPNPGQPIGRPPEERIVMTPLRPPNYYPLDVCLIMTSADSFLGAVSPSKGFFGNLADTTCKDERFSGHAHQGQFCWNGVEVGAYNR